MTNFLRSLTFLLSCLFCSLASAVDGLTELNNSCAIQGGCFIGDAPGYPITIDGSAGGSYRLTSDLIVPNENTDGIAISTSRISIDLNGFGIIRADCVAANSCTLLSGFGSGINLTNTAFAQISIKDGSITGMGLAGVILPGGQHRVEGLRVSFNPIGIDVAFRSVVVGNVAYANGTGIRVASSSIVAGNTTHLNLVHGINAQGGSSVQDNVSYDNQEHGIVAGTNCSVRGNTVRNYGFNGLSLSATTAYRDNVITGNANAVTGGVNMLGNSCNGSTICL